jgi:hypothetical protein
VSRPVEAPLDPAHDPRHGRLGVGAALEGDTAILELLHQALILSAQQVIETDGGDVHDDSSGWFVLSDDRP